MNVVITHKHGTQRQHEEVCVPTLDSKQSSRIKEEVLVSETPWPPPPTGEGLLGAVAVGGTSAFCS